jgi:hypothetical protein
MVAYPDGVGGSVRSTPTTLELVLVLVPPSVKTVTNCVFVIVAGRGIELVMVAGRGIELVLDVEGNKSVN